MNKRNRQDVDKARREARGREVLGVAKTDTERGAVADVDLKPKPMSTQDCWRDPEFPAAMMGATVAAYLSGEAGHSDIAWEQAMHTGARRGEDFVRRLREGQAR